MIDFCGLALAHPVVNGSGTFDAIAARRAFGDALLERFPFAAFVSKTITLEPRDGNPPPRLYETPAGLINSIGLPNKGLRGYLEHDLPELARLPVPLITNVMGSTAAELSRARRGASTRATRSPRSSSTSPARTSRPGSTSAPTPASSAACSREVRPLHRQAADRQAHARTPPTSPPSRRPPRTPGADAVSLINTLRAYAPHPRRAGAALAGQRDRRAVGPGDPRGRARAGRARSPRASRSRSSAWAASRAADTPRTCSRRARRSSPSAPRASAIRPREHGSHASLTICSQRAGTTSAERRDRRAIDLAENPANAAKTVKQSGSTSTSGRGRGEFARFALACGLSLCSTRRPMPPATNSPTKHSAAPERSLLQRMDALQRANEIRTRRAQLKRDLKAGRVSIHTLLLEPPEYVETAKVFDMLLAVPKYGRVKATRSCSSAGSRRARPSAASPSASAPSSSACSAGRARTLAGVARVFVITGPSGVGKGTLIRTPARAPARARAERLGHHARAAPGRGRTASTTTSSATQISSAASTQATSSSTPIYSGRRYGTLRSELERRTAAGHPVVLEIEVQGARQVRAALPEAVQVFIAPPSLDALRARLVGRGTDDAERGRARACAWPSAELAAQDEFAHVVVNDRLEDAVDAARRDRRRRAARRRQVRIRTGCKPAGVGRAAGTLAA